VCVKLKKKTESCTVVECHVSWWKLELVFLLDLRSWLIISGGFLLRKMANVSIHLIIISCLVLLYLMTPNSLIFFSGELFAHFIHSLIKGNLRKI